MYIYIYSDVKSYPHTILLDSSFTVVLDRLHAEKIEEIKG